MILTLYPKEFKVGDLVFMPDQYEVAEIIEIGRLAQTHAYKNTTIEDQHFTAKLFARDSWDQNLYIIKEKSLAAENKYFVERELT
jgi:hypothetical protein